MRASVAVGPQEVSARLLDLREAARLLGISYWTLRTLIFSGQIPYVRIGRRLLVDHVDVDQFISTNKKKEETF